jgi:hypothetical protein
LPYGGLGCGTHHRSHARGRVTTIHAVRLCIMHVVWRGVDFRASMSQSGGRRCPHFYSHDLAWRSGGDVVMVSGFIPRTTHDFSEETHGAQSRHLFGLMEKTFILYCICTPITIGGAACSGSRASPPRPLANNCFWGLGQWPQDLSYRPRCLPDPISNPLARFWGGIWLLSVTTGLASL